MDVKRVIKRGANRIVQRGLNTLGYEISLRRQAPSLKHQFFEAYPKLPVPPKEQIDAFANKALDPDYWRRLNPELSIDGIPERSAGLDIDALATEEIEKQIEKLRSEGYFQTNPILSSPTIDKMRLCVERLRGERWPATFAFIYDQFWDVASVSSVAKIATGFLGAECGLKTVFNFHVLPRKGASRWPPHKDLSTLTVWIPLCDATVDNSCMYLIQKNPVSSSGLTDFWERRYVTHGELRVLLQATKALPAPAGSVVGWTTEVVHWASHPSDGAHPRISMSLGFARPGDRLRPGERLFSLPCRLSFSQRIRLVCKDAANYDGIERAHPIFEGLAERLRER
jgi:hypothetical protein